MNTRSSCSLSALMNTSGVAVQGEVNVLHIQADLEKFVNIPYETFSSPKIV